MLGYGLHIYNYNIGVYWFDIDEGCDGGSGSHLQICAANIKQELFVLKVQINGGLFKQWPTWLEFQIDHNIAPLTIDGMRLQAPIPSRRDGGSCWLNKRLKDFRIDKFVGGRWEDIVGGKLPNTECGESVMIQFQCQALVGKFRLIFLSSWDSRGDFWIVVQEIDFMDCTESKYYCRFG